MIASQLPFQIAAVAAMLLWSGVAQAQSINNHNTQNYGFNLPTPPMPNGFDEVRTSDGTTCRSSISSSGAYLDIGGIGSNDTNARYGDATVYGRVIIPLGKRPGRIDCRTLYQLEIDRLKHELHLARSGHVKGADGDDDWQNSGWNND